MESPPLVVAFDCGGVLLDGIAACAHKDECPTGMYKWLAEKYPEKKELLVKAHRRNYDAWNRLKLEPEFTEADYWNVVIANEGLEETVEDMKKYLRDSLRHFPEVLQVARELKENGATIAIVSNHATEWFSDIAARFGFYEVFPEEYTLVSQTIRAAKPDHDIFDILMQRLKNKFPEISPQRVLFIDDKMPNVDAAKQFGFSAVQFDALVSPADELRGMLRNYGLL